MQKLGRAGTRLFNSTLVRFAIASLVPTLASGYVLTLQAQHAIEARTSKVYGDMTNAMFQMAADVVISPADLEPGASYSSARADMVNTLIARIGQSEDTVRVQIAGRDRRIVFSNHAGDVGTVLAREEPLARALSGEVATRFVRGEVDRAATGSRSVIEIYLPVRFGNDPAVHGLIVASGIDSSVVAGIEMDVRRMQVIMTVGLAMLWLCSLPIVSSVSRRLRRTAKENGYLALHDPLTGLPNRNLFNDRLNQAIAATARTGDDVAVLLIDLDGFKEVNDTLGHGRGDELLQAVGDRLRHVIRSSDTVARLGGDEFAVVVAGLDDEIDLAAVAMRIIDVLSSVVSVDGIEVAVDASIGGSLYPENARDAEELVRHADIAMYAAKAAHEHFRMYSPDIDSHSPSRLALAAELRRAISSDDQLVLFYQPVASADTAEVHAVEALVRWNHPVRGLLPPNEFVPMAEQSGLITRLSAKVLDLAARQARAWMDEGLDIAVSVNLSAADLRSTAILVKLEEILARYDLPASQIEVEVTETAILANPDAAVAIVTELRERGVRIALDDFGTGYSSLTYLKRLKPDRLKIDRSFVDAMVREPTDAQIVRSVIDLAHSLAIGVTAEGVESQEHWDLLRLLACDLVQGYYLARPLDQAAATAWLHDRSELFQNAR